MARHRRHIVKAAAFLSRQLVSALHVTDSRSDRQLNELNTEVVVISPQPETQTQRLAARYDVPMHFWVDENGRVAKQLGIFHRGGIPWGLELLGYQAETVSPTVILTDSNRQILFVDQTDNYRVRPKPDTFMEILTDSGVISYEHTTASQDTLRESVSSD